MLITRGRELLREGSFRLPHRKSFLQDAGAEGARSPLLFSTLLHYEIVHFPGSGGSGHSPLSSYVRDCGMPEAGGRSDGESRPGGAGGI